jgi:hypothetical protein
MATRKKYEELTDLENLQKQWTKLSGLHTREEWSAAIVRAATAAEISANFAIRSEFSQKSQLNTDFINNLLRWANGLTGKLEKILIPLVADDREKHKKIKSLSNFAKNVNSKRNSIAHQGEFCNEKEAQKVIEDAEEFIIGLIKLYKSDFKLELKKR